MVSIHIPGNNFLRFKCFNYNRLPSIIQLINGIKMPIF
jgi:hypothetical protein